ncbi:DNA-binding NarL/FixJ family response regulator [Micrococcus cohnii]|uniref:DNA-binding NarL/FixJ family response regulator n=1 Tax=Micrococcus cohnii TaxID=993416 RepID=A0A7W7GPZ9_9MICC|nr:response regulator transcription factor [Micrococcus cohnii]MBB4736105.1 DNA-binding NarL/FixJ family response regulator [Micrococcus cohnii]
MTAPDPDSGSAPECETAPGAAARTETGSAPIRVALVDDQQLIRSGLSMLIDSQPDLSVVAEAASGRDAAASPAVCSADVVLMDVRMPHMDGIAATRALLERTAPPRVVVLTTFDLDEYALEAIEAGASGFLLKDAPPEELLAAVRTVHRGDAVIAPSTTRRLLTHMAPRLRAESERETGHSDQRRAVESLTPREREVLERMADGQSNQDIAAGLFLSEATVKTHVGRVLAKLGVRDRVQAVVLAYRTGVVHP